MTESSNEDDSIAAIATGVGGGISIIRLSGKDAVMIADKVWRYQTPICKLPQRKLVLGEIVNSKNAVEDRCMAVRMPGPHSYTGEDVGRISLSWWYVCCPFGAVAIAEKWRSIR